MGGHLLNKIKNNYINEKQRGWVSGWGGSFPSEDSESFGCSKMLYIEA